MHLLQEGTKDRLSVLLAGLSASHCFWVPSQEGHHERLKIPFVIRGDGCRDVARAPTYKVLHFEEGAVGYSWSRLYAFLVPADNSFSCSSNRV